MLHRIARRILAKVDSDVRFRGRADIRLDPLNVCKWPGHGGGRR
jgi:hypothetical protein